MVSYREREVRCAVCGAAAVQKELSSVSTMGSADLDLRPPPMKRGTMNLWRQECASCGYAATDLGEADAHAKEVVRSDNYQALRRSEPDELARRFLCCAELTRDRDPAQAARELLAAAWVFDDAQDRARAKYYRERALPLMSLSEGGEEQAPEHAVMIDVLRRVGRFEEAARAIASARVITREPNILKVLELQERLIERGDVEAHRIEEAYEGEPKEQRPQFMWNSSPVLNYLFDAYHHLFDERARQAVRAYGSGKNWSCKDRELAKEIGEDPAAFAQRLCDELIAKNPEIFLNYCPKCGALARTPKSKNCRHCGYDWRIVS
jgi:ribosomal protein L37E